MDCYSFTLFSFKYTSLSSVNYSVSPIVEEEIEDLFSDSSDDGLDIPKAPSPDVKAPILSWPRIYHFPSPENFHQFVECPVTPPHTQQTPPQKYVGNIFLEPFSLFRFFFFVVVFLILLELNFLRELPICLIIIRLLALLERSFETHFTPLKSGVCFCKITSKFCVTVSYLNV